MCRLAMGLIKPVRIRLKGCQTGICAKVDRPSAIFGPREILGISVVENTAAKSNKALRPDT
jgi:hypothetical protein